MNFILDDPELLEVRHKGKILFRSTNAMVLTQKINSTGITMQVDTGKVYAKPKIWEKIWLEICANRCPVSVTDIRENVTFKYSAIIDSIDQRRVGCTTGEMTLLVQSLPKQVKSI